MPFALGSTFDNAFVRELPGDRSLDGNARTVAGACYSLVVPAVAPAPRLVAHSSGVAELLGLSACACESEGFLQLVAGNALLPGMEPYAAGYGGHQFGTWAGQLGDGRVIGLGEAVTVGNERWEVQLKGAGRTPYSRAGDGRAVLRSSLREFLASEAMHHLGIPTTRALSLVTTGERVLRDPLYDGHPREEQGAIVCRVARSFLRFGSFELPSARGELEVLRRLVDYTLETQFPELDCGVGEPARYAAFFHEVCRRTATLMVHWQRVGFVHGVMNTDNMSILGLTMDYGPFGFLDHFAADFTPNTSDPGRYGFGSQPRIAKWNLLKLAEALFPLTLRSEPLAEGLRIYTAKFESEHASMLTEKLGLRASDPSRPGDDPSLASELFQILGLVETDMTLFFRGLADVPAERAAVTPDDELLRPLLAAYYDPASLVGDVRQRTLSWLRRYAARVRNDARPQAERRARMNAVNPKFLLRNYQAQLAIEAAERGDASVLVELHDVLRRPYDDQPTREELAQKRPDWARDRAGCSRLSCSS